MKRDNSYFYFTNPLNRPDIPTVETPLLLCNLNDILIIVMLIFELPRVW